MEQNKRRLIARRLGLLCGFVGIALAFIGTAKLLTGREVGTELFLNMIALGCIGFLLVAASHPKSGPGDAP